MASPTYINSASTAGSFGQTLVLTMPTSPAPASGQLLLAFVAGESQIGGDATSGWTKIGTANNGGSEYLSVYKRAATGSDATTIGSTTSGGFATRYGWVVCFDNWDGVLANVGYVAATTATLNPPSLNMGASRDHMFVAFARNNNNNITGAPTNYTLIGATTGTVRQAVAYRAMTATQTEDPGAFAGTSSAAVSGTIGIRPATIVTLSGAATPTATATLSADGIRVVPATAAPSADSTLTAAGVPERPAEAALSATATLAAAGTRVAQASASLAADSTLTALGSLAGSGADLTATATLTATAEAAIGATASPTADSSLTANAAVTTGGAAALVADATVTASATTVRSATATFTAVSSLAATVGGQVRTASAVMSATATLTATATGPTYAPLVFEDMEVQITPPGGYMEPLPLTLGPNQKPNDVRMALVAASATAGNFADPIQMVPNPPTGFTAAYSLNPNDETRGVFYRRLVAGDADTSVAWVKPPGWQYFAWALISARGVDPANAPTAGELTVAHTVGDAFCTVSSVSVPAAGVMVFWLATIADPEGLWPSWGTSIGIPTGWRHLVATDKSGDKYFAYDTNPGLGLVAKEFAGSGSTGSVTFPIDPGSHAFVGFWAYLRKTPNTSSTGGAITATDSIAAGSSSSGTNPVSAGDPITTYDSVGPAFNPLHGTITQTYRLSSPVEASIVMWDAVTPAGSTVTVETSINNGLSWDLAENWKPVPRLLAGDSTTRTVLVRGTLTRQSAAGGKPRLKWLKVRIGCRKTTDELIPTFYGPVDKTKTKITAGSSGGSGGSSGGDGAFAHGGGLFGGGATVKVHATDASRLIKLAAWEQPYLGQTGLTYTELGRAMVLDRLPSQSLFSQVSSEHVLDDSLLVWGIDQGGDPYQDVRGVYTAIGHECFLDVAGAFVSRPVPDPRRGPIVWDFDHTVEPRIIGLESELDTSQIVNGWVIKGESTSSTNPVSAFAFNTDTGSKYNIFPRPVGIGKRIKRPPAFQLAKTTQQCLDIANGALNNSLGLANTVKIGITPHPGIATGDCARINSPETGVLGRFLIQGYDLPDSPVQQQMLTCFRQTDNP